MSFQNAFLGSLVADAVSMPAHWYYDTDALDRDYGDLRPYQKPRNPHPDSILWRSVYSPNHPKADVLHGQSKFWGKKNVHYHQHLQAGENTLNLQLSAELYRQIILNGEFSVEKWLLRYAQVMLTPNWHNDTYVEECHRNFFTNYGRGKALRSCGTKDYHIGALSMLPGLFAGLEAIDQADPAHLLESALCLVRCTHDDERALRATADFARLLINLSQDHSLRETIQRLSLPGISIAKLGKWEDLPDRSVVGGILSSACYLPESLLASLFFAWKYHHDFSQGVLANAKAGGDNCHRGVVVGSLLGIQNGVPKSLLRGLKMMEKLRCDLQIMDSPQLLRSVI